MGEELEWGIEEFHYGLTLLNDGTGMRDPITLD